MHPSVGLPIIYVHLPFSKLAFLYPSRIAMGASEWAKAEEKESLTYPYFKDLFHS